MTNNIFNTKRPQEHVIIQALIAVVVFMTIFCVAIALYEKDQREISTSLYPRLVDMVNDDCVGDRGKNLLTDYFEDGKITNSEKNHIIRFCDGLKLEDIKNNIRLDYLERNKIGRSSLD